MKPRVLVTRHVYPAASAILREAGCVVDYNDSRDALAPEKRRQMSPGATSC